MPLRVFYRYTAPSYEEQLIKVWSTQSKTAVNPLRLCAFARDKILTVLTFASTAIRQ
jgi:hypothetical protein